VSDPTCLQSCPESFGIERTLDTTIAGHGNPDDGFAARSKYVPFRLTNPAKPSLTQLGRADVGSTAIDRPGNALSAVAILSGVLLCRVISSSAAALAAPRRFDSTLISETALNMADRPKPDNRTGAQWPRPGLPGHTNEKIGNDQAIAYAPHNIVEKPAEGENQRRMENSPAKKNRPPPAQLLRAAREQALKQPLREKQYCFCCCQVEGRESPGEVRHHARPGKFTRNVRPDWPSFTVISVGKNRPAKIRLNGNWRSKAFQQLVGKWWL